MVGTRLSAGRSKSTDGSVGGDSGQKTHEEGLQKVGGKKSRPTQRFNLLGTTAASGAQEQTTATAESASLEEGTELSNNKTNNKTNTPTLQEQNNAEEGGGAVFGGEVDYKSRRGKQGMYKLYPKEGILDGCPFFSSVEEGYTAFSRLKSAERKAFDPT